MKNLKNYLNSAIFFSYFTLAAVTPLLFTTRNTELFEVPKMYFVYFCAIFILVLTTTKFILEKRKSIPTDLVSILFAVFILTQVASTLTSLDKFTSVFGYPSRLNGGLLSQVAYLIIFAGALINLNKEAAKKILLTILAGAFAVALWGIPSHFGKDPNCLILTGNLNSSCWQREFDPTIRIFSTQGQPNWLASYLILVLPISIAQIIKTANAKKKTLFIAVALALFLALIFTNSRAGILGLFVSLTSFGALIGINKLKNQKTFLILIAAAAILFVLFGQTLFSRIYQAVNPSSQSTPGTESGQIRLIVWKGAIEVLKNNPLLGTGPETFAYSYYKYRPLEHNQTTEWNFFYNKAHNEILNIFANTGIVGGLSYIALIAGALLTLIKQTNSREAIFAKAAISSILGYQTSVFFGFSTVTPQLLMFLLIASSLIITEKTKTAQISLSFLGKIQTQATLLVTVILGLWLLSFIGRLYLADVFLSRAKGMDTSLQSLLIFTNAIDISPAPNPFLLSDAANSLATYASSTTDEENTLSLQNQSAILAQNAQSLSPQNIIIARKLGTTYLLLASKNEAYSAKAQELGQVITDLAPTDPQSYVSQAKILVGIGKELDAKKSLEHALELKGDYVEALELLDQVNKQLTNGN